MMIQRRIFLLIGLLINIYGQLQSDSDAITIRSIGFSSSYAQNLLTSLISQAGLNLLEQSGPVNVYSSDSIDRYILLAGDSDKNNALKYDACVVYLDPLLLQNEELTIQRLLDAQSSLNDVQSGDSDIPTLMVVYSYSSQKHLQKFAKLLESSISLHENSNLSKTVSRMNEEIASGRDDASGYQPDFSIRSLTIPFNRQVNKKVVAEFKDFLSSFDRAGTSVSDAKEGETLTEPVVSVPSNRGNRSISHYIAEINSDKAAVPSTAGSAAAVSANYAHFEDYLSRGRKLLVKAKEDQQSHPVTSETQIAVAPDLFRSIVDKHIMSTLSGLSEQIKMYHAVHGGVLNAVSLSLVRAIVAKELLSLWAPVYKTQLQLHASQVIREFNREYQDLVITSSVERDLWNLRDKIVRRFERVGQSLTPTAGVHSVLPGVAAEGSDLLLSGNGSPEYNAQSLVKAVNSSINPFVQDVIHKYQAVGVIGNLHRPASISVAGYQLPPIEVSVHALAQHPLNLRDYRQDVLTGPESGDELVLRKNNRFDLHNAKVTPVTVRRALQRQIGVVQEGAGSGLLGRIKGYFQTRELKEQSEFSREMLMLPLSVRDYTTKLFDRSRDDTATGAVFKATGSEGDEYHGNPEQLLKWTMPGLSEARESIAQLQKITRQPTAGPDDGLRGAVVDRWMASSKSPNKYEDKAVNYNFSPSGPSSGAHRSIFSRISAMIPKSKM